MTQKQFQKKYFSEHEIWQAFHTGLWGFSYISDCANLAAAIFKSKHAAACARAKAAKEAFAAYVYDNKEKICKQCGTTYKQGDWDRFGGCWECWKKNNQEVINA